MNAGESSINPLLWGIGTGVIHGVESHALVQEMEFILNSVGPTHLPTLEELMRLWYTGWFRTQPNGQRAFRAFCIQHGADFTEIRRLSEGGEDRQKLWRAILEMRTPSLPPDRLREWWRKMPAMYPDDNGPLRRDQVRQMIENSMRRMGFSSRAVQRFLIEESELPGEGSVVEWTRLGLLNTFDANSVLMATGLGPRDRNYTLRGRFAPIDAGTLLRAADNHATDETFAQRWQLDADKPDWWDVWSERAGYKYLVDHTKQWGESPAPPGAATANDPVNRTWADVLWRLSNRLPGLGDLRQFLHRYRGDPNDPNTFSVPGVRPLTLDEANSFMDALQIPNGLRTYYYNVMYEPVSIRHIKSFIATRQTNPAEVAGWLMDNGMRPDLATRTAQVLYIEQAEKDMAPAKRQAEEAARKLVSAVEKAYEAGILDEADAQAQMVAQGVPPTVAVVKLQTIELELQTTIVEQVVARTRSEVFGGMLTIPAALTRLTGAGIDPRRAAQLTASWQARFGEKRIHASTSQILSYMRKGYLTRNQALQRLVNLGWDNADILLLLRDVQAQIAQDTAKTIAAAEAQKTREEGAVIRQLQKTAGLAHALMSRLKTITPPAKVIQWYKAGLWTEQAARDRLRLLGYTDEVIDTMLLQALESKGSKPVKGTP